VVAAGTRLGMFGPGFSLLQVLGYDDSAYFAGAQMLVEGHLPYHTFPFVQPPGSLLVASPFAAAGSLLGGDVGMAMLRVAMIALAAVTSLLIADLLRPYGIVAALGGSLLFATHGFVVVASRTFYLEPFLALGVVWTFCLLRRDSDRIRRYFLIGLILGTACTVKMWAGVDVAVFALFLAVVRGRRKMLAWLGGVMTAIVVICLPFFAVAPGAMWHQVVVAQLGRGTVQPLLDRIITLDAFAGFPWVPLVLSPLQSQVLVGIALAVAFSPLAAQLVRRRAPRHWSPAGWWAALALAEVVTLLSAPTFFAHYWVWPAGSLALGFGRALGALERRWSRVPLIVAIGVLSVSLGHAVLRFRTYAVFAPTAAVRTFAASHDCTYFGIFAIQGDATGADVPMYAPCRKWPDPIGVELALGTPGRHDPLFALKRDPAWQTGVRNQLRAADSAVLCRELPDAAFDASTVRLFRERFVEVGRRSTTAMTCHLWDLRPTRD
jgi:hypothetical protein